MAAFMNGFGLLNPQGLVMTKSDSDSMVPIRLCIK